MVVQEYLDSTSGFYVDSIFETDESQQVAKIAERVYYRMLQQFPDLLFTMKDTNLDAVSDPDKPNFLLIPKQIQEIQESEIYYNVSEFDGDTLQYRKIQYVTPKQFLELTAKRSDSTSNSRVVEGFDSNRMVIYTDRFPQYCTSFDGKYVVFDSFNSQHDTTMQASKSRVVATEQPVFLQENDFVIPIPEHLSETYLDMFLDEAYNLVYQQPNAMLSQRARSARIKLQQDSKTLGGGRAKRSYGRRGTVSQRVPRGHGYE